MRRALGAVGGAVEPAGAELAAAALRDATANLIMYVAQGAVVRELVPEGDSWEADKPGRDHGPVPGDAPVHAAIGDGPAAARLPTPSSGHAVTEAREHNSLLATDVGAAARRELPDEAILDL